MSYEFSLQGISQQKFTLSEFLHCCPLSINRYVESRFKPVSLDTNRWKSAAFVVLPLCLSLFCSLPLCLYLMWHNHDGDGVVDVLIDNHNQANDAADDKLPLPLPLPLPGYSVPPHLPSSARWPCSGSAPASAVFNDDVALDRWVDGLIALK